MGTLFGLQKYACSHVRHKYVNKSSKKSRKGPWNFTTKHLRAGVFFVFVLIREHRLTFINQVLVVPYIVAGQNHKIINMGGEP